MFDFDGIVDLFIPIYILFLKRLQQFIKSIRNLAF